LTSNSLQTLHQGSFVFLHFKFCGKVPIILCELPSSFSFLPLVVLNQNFSHLGLASRPTQQSSPSPSITPARCLTQKFLKERRERENPSMNAPDLAKISSSHHHPSPPLARRVHAPSRPPYPTCQPQGLTLAPSVDHALDREPGRTPRNPPLPSVPPTKPARAAAPSDLA
jgi:hypothetical protein